MVSFGVIAWGYDKVKEKFGEEKAKEIKEKIEVLNREWNVRKRLASTLNYLKEQNIPYVFHRYDNITPILEALSKCRMNALEALNRAGKGSVGGTITLTYLIPDYEEDPPELFTDSYIEEAMKSKAKSIVG
jgi:hypothetical protein